MDGGDDPGDGTHNAGGVSPAGQIFGEVDVSGAKLVDGAVAEAGLRLAGEGDQVLPAGSACQSLKNPGGKALKTIPLALCNSVQAGWDDGSITSMCDSPSSPEYNLIDATTPPASLLSPMGF